MMQFSATIALGLAPLVVFGGAALLRPAPPVPVKPVATESITARRMDEAAFGRRWPVELMSRRSDPFTGCGDASPTRSGKDLLQAGCNRNAATGKPEARKARQNFEVHQMEGGDAHSRENTGKPVGVVARSRPPAVRVVRRASLRPTDVCARHGLRKVETVRGKWKGWRCRR